MAGEARLHARHHRVDQDMALGVRHRIEIGRGRREGFRDQRATFQRIGLVPCRDVVVDQLAGDGVGIGCGHGRAPCVAAAEAMP
jgi:hypothetical protein